MTAPRQGPEHRTDQRDRTAYHCRGCGTVIAHVCLPAGAFVELVCPQLACRRFQRLDGPYALPRVQARRRGQL